MVGLAFAPVVQTTSPPRKDQSDRRQEIARQVALVAEQERLDLERDMGNADGRRRTWRMIQQSGIFEPTFNTNAMAMARTDGARLFGIHLWELICRYCPEFISPMVQENYEPADGNDRNTNR